MSGGTGLADGNPDGGHMGVGFMIIFVKMSDS